MRKILQACFFVSALCVSRTAEAYYDRTSSLLVESDSGRVLVSENATDKRYPASLTKMMTLYMVFDALERGEIRMDQLLPVSAKAARQPRSRMGLKAGTTISVENAVFAMISKSANDAAVVVAEALAGSEEQFADKMTRVARELGMKNTRFKNASGLHHKDQITTAQDMVVLSKALIEHFPEYYKLFSVRGFNLIRCYLCVFVSINSLLCDYAMSAQLRTSPVKICLICSIVRLSTEFAVLTMTAMPSCAMTIGTSPFSISLSFTSREAIPRSIVPVPTSRIPPEESDLLSSMSAASTPESSTYFAMSCSIRG